MPLIAIEKLKEIVIKTLLTNNVSIKDATIIADTITYAHQTGKGSHGISRLPIYIKKIKNGSINPKNELFLEKNNKAIACLDAKNSFGQIAAEYAINLAISKAKKYGVGIVGVKNSNNFGTLAYFLNKAVNKKYICFIFSNSAPAIAPWGSNKALFGTNPIGFGFPTKAETAPIIFDMATSLAARGKIRLAAKNNEKIPFGWALDKNGNPTDNPIEALEGTMIPIGEHKGYGLTLTADILAGLLTNSAFAGNVLPLNTNGEFSRNGHFIQVLNIDFFMNIEEYYKKISFLIEKIKKQSEAVKLPGELSFNNIKINMTNIEISESILSELRRLLLECNVKVEI